MEIGHDVRVDTGKPVFLLSGLHHAREWPTVELTLEFAWDVLGNDGVDPRITALLESAKLIVVPVVNPDGFDMSRTRIHEQKRKNCRIASAQIPTRADCAASANANAGVDLNRNYGVFWGGNGASDMASSSNYRGEAPYSDPEHHGADRREPGDRRDPQPHARRAAPAGAELRRGTGARLT